MYQPNKRGKLDSIIPYTYYLIRKKGGDTNYGNG